MGPHKKNAEYSKYRKLQILQTAHEKKKKNSLFFSVCHKSSLHLKHLLIMVAKFSVHHIKIFYQYILLNKEPGVNVPSYSHSAW